MFMKLNDFINSLIFNTNAKVKKTTKKRKVSKKKHMVKKSTGKKRRVLKVVNYQTGKRKSIKLDRMRKALEPGKRVSKKSGKVYWETRRNRSDLKRGI
jgi:hypothetical protein